MVFIGALIRSTATSVLVLATRKSQAALTSLENNLNSMSKTILSRIKSHFTMYELESFLKTFAAIFATEAAFQINTILAGDFGKEALIAVVAATLRSAVKAIFTMYTGKVGVVKEIPKH